MHLMIAAAPFFAFPSFETLRFATLLRMRWLGCDSEFEGNAPRSSVVLGMTARRRAAVDRQQIKVSSPLSWRSR